MDTKKCLELMQVMIVLTAQLIGWIEACTEIRKSQVITYKTNQQVLIDAGAVQVPIIIDLVQMYKICNNIITSDTLAGMFKSMNAQTKKQTDLFLGTSQRQKRIAPLVALRAVTGVSAAHLLWEKYSYNKINDKIDSLYTDINGKTSYLKKIMIADEENNRQDFIAVRRQLRQLSARATETACNMEKNLTYFIMENHLLDEFDDLIASLRTSRFTSKMIPPAQLLSLLEALPKCLSICNFNLKFSWRMHAQVSLSLTLNLTTKNGFMSFSWPSPDDVQDLRSDEILCKISTPPRPVGKSARTYTIQNVEEIQTIFDQHTSEE
ncbi:unnamed protein product [Bemisia tabaci]|uniref:Uncharacterized protein n=1 Tax=Bemisia tabaci TaxID=7038 RepID=A0A9P0EYM3_BEMTA|nr:unnamed protein product [Bemisia tabaci]